MNDWKKVRLSDVADIKLSNVDKKTNIAERPIRLCNYTDVYKNTFINSYKSKDFMIASCNDNEYEKFVLKKGQVAITKDSEKRDDIGISTYISESFDDVVLGYHLSLITPFDDKLDGRFLNYWFNTTQAKIYFENNAGGSGQRCTLPIDIIKGIPIKLPDLPTQQKIASVLSALDDKIELNNRINAELEAMAKTLYDYWFVQFDFPNEEAKPYKSSGGKMVYNQTLKREIPDGWEVKKMSFFEMYQPQTISEKELNNNHKYYVFGANGIIGKYDKFNHLDSEIVVTCRGNSCGNIIRTLPESWITGNAMVIKSIEDYIESEFIFQMLNWIGIKKVITGSGQPQITRVNLETLDFVLPKRNILSQFNELVRPIVEKKLQLFKQNQELSALRDWLLPMLMNGQVKVG